jgi:oligopeptide/dipeptide ABC transporter ATP-binding protein
MTAEPTLTQPSQAEVPLLEVQDLRVWFPIRRGVLRRRVGWAKAVDDVTFSVSAGRTMALVGESGAGKTTTGRAVVRVQPVTSGTIRFKGRSLTGLDGTDLRRMRRGFQMIFQDPFGSLDPRQSVGDILTEPLAVHGLVSASDRPARVRELLSLVGLDPRHADRYPREFSGGQRQRVGIARALAVEPELIVCDEPVSSLDVSIQAQIINLLTRLQREFGMAYLFIAHDLAVVRHIANQVAVMYLGRIVEMGPVDELYAQPRHPYTLALLSVALAPESTGRRRIVLSGEIPSPDSPPAGCSFRPRCWLWSRLGQPELCAQEPPPLLPLDGGRSVACHFSDQTAELGAAMSDESVPSGGPVPGSAQPMPFASKGGQP